MLNTLERRWKKSSLQKLVKQTEASLDLILAPLLLYSWETCGSVRSVSACQLFSVTCVIVLNICIKYIFVCLNTYRKRSLSYKKNKLDPFFAHTNLWLDCVCAFCLRSPKIQRYEHLLTVLTETLWQPCVCVCVWAAQQTVSLFISQTRCRS